MLVHNTPYRDKEFENEWIGCDIYQTLVFENITLYPATGLFLPSVPRIGESLQVYGGTFAGKVTNITYQAHYNTYYDDNPDAPTILLGKDLPNFNYCTIKIELEKKVFDYTMSAYEIEESHIDQCYQLLASRKERAEPFKRWEIKEEDRPDYAIDFLIDVKASISTDHVLGDKGRYFDGEAFDKKYNKYL